MINVRRCSEMVLSRSKRGTFPEELLNKMFGSLISRLPLGARGKAYFLIYLRESFGVCFSNKKLIEKNFLLFFKRNSVKRLFASERERE